MLEAIKMSVTSRKQSTENSTRSVTNARSTQWRQSKNALSATPFIISPRARNLSQKSQFNSESLLPPNDYVLIVLALISLRLVELRNAAAYIVYSIIRLCMTSKKVDHRLCQFAHLSKQSKTKLFIQFPRQAYIKSRCAINHNSLNSGSSNNCYYNGNITIRRTVSSARFSRPGIRSYIHLEISRATPSASMSSSCNSYYRIGAHRSNITNGSALLQIISRLTSDFSLEIDVLILPKLSAFLSPAQFRNHSWFHI